MFNKEESNRTKKVSVANLNCKKIGKILLTLSLILMLSNSVNAEESLIVETTDCDDSKLHYFDRVFKYSQEKKYDQKMVDLYKNSTVVISGVSYPIDKLYLLFDTEKEGYNIHLISVLNGKNDILTGSEEEKYNRIAILKDTTAFINLINSDCVSIDDKKRIITITDNNKAYEIIRSWDGLIHNLVPETDAVEDKDILRGNL